MLKELCDICKAIPWSFFDDFAKETTKPTSSSIAHQPSFAALQKAGEDGCPLCGLIHYAIVTELKSFGPGTSAEVEQGDSIALRCDRYNSKPPPEVEEKASHPIFRLSARIKEHNREVFSAAISFAYVPAWIKNLSPNRSTSDLRLIDTWLSECTMNHRQCKAPNDASSDFCPTRLLDVNTSRGSLYLKLIETNANSRLSQTPTVDYIALSYCWGKDFPMEAVTLTSNYEKHLSAILLLDLPKTYQNAIRLARDLGVRYIWIDALCIIQDSPEDWQRESPMMAQVYSRSLFTLAVESASGMNEGFRLHERREGREKAFFLKKSGSRPSNHHIIYFTPRALTEWYFLDESALRTRGWAYQERTLSIRKLHLSNNEVPWGWRLSTLSDLHASENALLRIDTLPEHTLAAVWGNIVTEYSLLNLTKELDRLPALSGLAERMCFKLKESMQETIEDTQYVAGLWNTSNLLPSLLWRVRGLLFGKRPRAYLAPSWSWASINSAVSMPTHWGDFGLDKHSASEILEVSVQICGLNPYGEVSGGFIRIKGRLKAAISLGKDRTLYRSLDNDSAIVWETQQAHDIMIADTTTSRCVGIVRWDMEIEGAAKVEIFCLRLGLNLGDLGRTVHCIQLDTEKFGSQNFAEAMGLALVPTEVKGEYRRVGVILRMSEDWLKDCVETVVTII